MATESVRDEIIHQLDVLTPAQQRALLDYARRLQTIPSGTPGKVLLEHMQDFDFAPGEVDDMMRAIEEACERINPDEWK
jgi:hypothetical protein